FASDHPLSKTHHVAMYPEDMRRVPNFVGGLLPRVDKGNHEYYCLTMLTLFKPWRMGHVLKHNSDCTWEVAMAEHEFSNQQKVVMANFNLRYECLDAQDDFCA
ncbi:hypothetical protein ARMGADRAFT_876723, partial [Armillaria gallica]